MSYTAIETFKSSRGNIFFKGQEISSLKYFSLKDKDKKKFVKSSGIFVPGVGDGKPIVKVNGTEKDRT